MVGFKKSSKKRPRDDALTVGGGDTVLVSSSYALNHAALERSRLRRSRKLSLVLDLDHTLVHCALDPRACAFVGRGDVRTFLLPHGGSSGRGEGCDGGSVFDHKVGHRHYLKLRPGLVPFLRRASEMYELSIYTAGTRGYAMKVAHAVCRAMVGMGEDVDWFDEVSRGECGGDMLNMDLLINRRAGFRFRHLVAGEGYR